MVVPHSRRDTVAGPDGACPDRTAVRLDNAAATALFASTATVLRAELTAHLVIIASSSQRGLSRIHRVPLHLKFQLKHALRSSSPKATNPPTYLRPNGFPRKKASFAQSSTPLQTSQLVKSHDKFLLPNVFRNRLNQSSESLGKKTAVASVFAN